MRTVLITGAAGFIGSHLAKRLLASGDQVVGVDDLNDYYDVRLKRDRLEQLTAREEFTFIPIDIADHARMAKVFRDHTFDVVVNLAAQPGVRHSLKNPHAYVNSNVVGFLNILEGCRHAGTKHLVFASSSSVYGMNGKVPFSVHDTVDHPQSLYAATKKSNELMAHSYAYLFKLPCTGLRFFTVYGPWGRPDMAYYSFAKDIIEGKAINVFNYGNMQRDFTYIDDIIEGVCRVLDRTPQPDPVWDRMHPDPATSSAPYKLYNIGNNTPVEILYFIKLLEKCLGKKANMNLLPMQPEDVAVTNADVDDLMADVGFKPSTPIEEGIARFVDWFRSYHRIG